MGGASYWKNKGKVRKSRELKKIGENRKVTTQLRVGWVWGGCAERVGVKGAPTTGRGYARLALARRMR